MENKIDKMIELFYIQGCSKNEEEMVAYISHELEKIKGLSFYIDKRNNIYATKGIADIYPCVVAHTDTVHYKHIDNLAIFKDGDIIFGMDMDTIERAPTGSDDRAGIFAALELLREKDVLKAAFFVEEELGCLGSADADMKFFEDVSLALQTDRQGHKEFVYEIYGTILQSDEFKEAVKPLLDDYGYEFASGGLTDVMQLTDEGIGVCVANITSGYYNPHTSEEYQCVSELMTTYNLMSDIIDGLGYTKRWEHEYTHAYGGWGTHSSYRRDSSYYDDYYNGVAGPADYEEDYEEGNYSDLFEPSDVMHYTEYFYVFSEDSYYTNEGDYIYDINKYEQHLREQNLADMGMATGDKYLDGLDEHKFADDPDDILKLKQPVKIPVKSKSSACKNECDHWLDEQTGEKFCMGCTKYINSSTD